MKIKKTSIKILFTGILLNLLSSPATAWAFSDLGTNHPDYQYINYFYEQGVFSGYPDGTFQPERVLNRAEQLKIYLLLDGMNPDANLYKNCFSDVGEEWFARYVCYAKAQGIVQGYADGQFKPAQQVNKVEALKMLAETQDWNLITATVPSFSDAPLTEWYSTYVETAKKSNFIDDTPSLFGPGDGISRANTAELMFRSLAMTVLKQNYSAALDSEILKIDLGIGLTDPATDPGTQTGDPLLLKNYSISPGNGQAKVGGYYDVDFSLIDNTGNLIKGAKLEIRIERPFVALNPDVATAPTLIPYTETNGLYHFQVSSKIAGQNVLLIKNTTTGQIYSDTLDFKTEAPYELSLVSQSGPGSSSRLLGEKNYTLMMNDRYGNIIEQTEFSGSSNDADLSVVKKYNGTAEVKLAAKAYGPAAFQVKAISGGVEKTFSQTVDFLPIGFGNDPAYPTGSQVSVPVLLFLPDQTTGLDGVDFNLEVPGNLNVIGVNLGSVLDGEAKAPVKTPEGRWRIDISGQLQFSGGFDGKIGDLIIDGLPEGKFNLDGETQLRFNTPDYKETMHRDGGKTQEGDNALYVPMQRPLAQIAGKSEKRICIDVLVQPGTNVTRAMIESDIKQSEDIFYKNAQSCNCPHYLKIDFSIYNFTAEQWNQITTGDGFLGEMDYVDFINSDNPPIRPHTWCTKMFYVNNIESRTLIGESIRTEGTDGLPGVGSFIKMDNARDRDGRSLAHELAHHLSGHRVSDPDDPDGPTQGAGDPGNLMSYNEVDDEGNLTQQLTGDTLTAAQCELMYWDHSRFANYPAK